jgi:hypothetical protein
VKNSASRLERARHERNHYLLGARTSKYPGHANIPGIVARGQEAKKFRNRMLAKHGKIPERFALNYSVKYTNDGTKMMNFVTTLHKVTSTLYKCGLIPQELLQKNRLSEKDVKTIVSIYATHDRKCRPVIYKNNPSQFVHVLNNETLHIRKEPVNLKNITRNVLSKRTYPKKKLQVLQSR